MIELNGALSVIEKSFQSCKWVTINNIDYRSYDSDTVEQVLVLIAAIQKAVPDTRTALLNTIKPHYDMNIICPHCKREEITNNGEWLLWCGSEKSAQSLLDAAKLLQQITGVADD